MKGIFKIVLLLLLLTALIVNCIEAVNNEEMELLSHSECCVFNESIIKKVDGTLLDIINDTGDWLLSTNGTTLFACPINGSRCEDDHDYKPDIVLYAVQTPIYCISFFFASCTIALHLYFKELQTVFGVLIIMFCLSHNINGIITFIHNRFQYTHTIDNSAVCAMFVYLRGVMGFAEHSIKFTILLHFTSLMYNSYMSRSDGPRFDKALICKYLVFICSLTTVYTLVVIPYDVGVSKNAFKTVGRYCGIIFVDGTAVIIFIVQLALLSVVEMATFGIGMLFYSLISKRCCKFKRSDIRVSFILVATARTHRILFLVIYASSNLSSYAFLASSVATSLEHSILFTIFLTSKKVKSSLSSIPNMLHIRNRHCNCF